MKTQRGQSSCWSRWSRRSRTQGRDATLADLPTLGSWALWPRRYHKKVIGTVEQYPDESAAHLAVAGRKPPSCRWSFLPMRTEHQSLAGREPLPHSRTKGREVRPFRALDHFDGTRLTLME